MIVLVIAAKTQNQNKKKYIRILERVPKVILPLSSWVGTGSYTTSTTNMYHKDFKEPKPAL